MRWLAKLGCRWFGHSRDWPEMERCCRCGAPMALEPIGGWVVAHLSGDQFRRWGPSGPEWTDKIGEAMWFARREDAEAFRAENWDSWFVLPVWQGHDPKWMPPLLRGMPE